MRIITPHEKIGENSRVEIERISFLLSKYCKNSSMPFIDGVSYLMAKVGYKKYNYIPVDSEDLYLISQLSIKYMRTYATKPEQFISILLSCNEFCLKYGYSKEMSQTTLKLDG